jgi:hypothetical protein
MTRSYPGGSPSGQSAKLFQKYVLCPTEKIEPKVATNRLEFTIDNQSSRTDPGGLKVPKCGLKSRNAVLEPNRSPASAIRNRRSRLPSLCPTQLFVCKLKQGPVPQFTSNKRSAIPHHEMSARASLCHRRRTQPLSNPDE